MTAAPTRPMGVSSSAVPKGAPNSLSWRVWLLGLGAAFLLGAAAAWLMLVR
jgi:hypothetical protein